MTTVAHQHHGEKPEGAPRSQLAAPIPPPRDPADGERPRRSEPMLMRDAIVEYITKVIADAPQLPAEARAHLAALLTDTADEA